MIIITLLAYRKLFGGYFEQDEWHTFGRLIYALHLSGINFWRYIFPGDLFVHFAPLAVLTKYFIFTNFFLQAKIYFIFSIVFHLSVSVAVYFLVRLIVKDKITSLLAALFFAVNGSHNQAVSWIGTFDGTQGACLFGVLSLIFLFLYINKKGYHTFILSLIFLLVALLFKETAFTFLVIYIIQIFLYGRKLFNKKMLLSFMGVVVFYFVLRILNTIIKPETPSLIALGTGSKSLSYILYNLISSSFKILPQIIIPQNLLINLSGFLTDKMIPLLPIWTMGPWSLEGAFVYDVVTVFVGILLALFLIRFYLKSKDLSEKKGMFYALAIVFMTIAPLVILNSYLIFWDSRYLYPASIGVAVLIAEFLKNKHIPVILLLFLCFVHFVSLGSILSSKEILGETRQQILVDMSRMYSKLPQKVIFYVESNTSYYGLPDEEKIMPFQSGFGQTLLVYYYQKEKFPKEFYDGDFLWDIKSQGYMETGGRGFGYFRDLDLLKQTYTKYNLGPSSIFAFSWNGKANIIGNISDRIRQEVGYAK